MIRPFKDPEREREKRKLEKIPGRPSAPKPCPPKAPEILRKTSQESENAKKTEEVKVAPVSLAVQESRVSQTEESIWIDEGSQVLGFGHYMRYTYREARSWICSGTLNVSGILQGCNGVDAKAVKFMNWVDRLQQAIDTREAAA